MRNMYMIVLSAFLSASLLHGCGGGSEDGGNPAAVPVTDIVLTASSVELDVKNNTVYQINPDVRPANAADKTVRYSSNDDAVATVDENGLVTAVSAGNAVISVISFSNPSVKSILNVNVYADNSGGGAGDTGTNIIWNDLPSSSITGSASVFDEILPEPDTKVTPDNILALIGHYRIEYMTVQSPDGFKLVDNIIGSGNNMRGEIAVNAVPCDKNPNSCPVGLTIKMQYKSQFHPDIVNKGIPESIRFIRTDIYSPLSSLTDIPGEFAKLGADIVEDTAKPGEYVVKFTLNSPDLPMPKGYTMFVTLKKIADDTLGNPKINLDNSKYFSETSTGGNIPVSSISVNNKEIILTTGGTTDVSYSVLPLDATNKNVKFSSDNPDVASVSDTGRVTAKSAGRAIITVTTEDGGKTDTAEVTVSGPEIPVESVQADTSNVSLDINPAIQNGNADVILKALPEDASNKKLIIAGNSGANVLQANMKDNGDGTYTLSLTAAAESQSPVTVTVISENNKEAKAVITVSISDTTIRPSSVSLSETTKTLTEGDTFNLIATVYPDNAYNKTVEFSSDNVNIATVDSKGTVTAKSEGTANITAKTSDGNKTAVCAVTVQKAFVSVQSISIPSELTLKTGAAPTTLTVTFTPADATNKNVTAFSSDDNVAVVEVKYTDGNTCLVVTPGNEGTATITVKNADGIEAAPCAVTVSSSAVEVTAVSITNKPSDNELKKNDSYQLRYDVSPATATDKNVTFNSSNPDILTVDDTGKVTAKKAGTAIVRASSASKSDIYDEFEFYVWETEDVTGTYDVYSLNITYNGTTVTSNSIRDTTDYFYDKRAFSISTAPGGNLDVSGKFQLVWDYFIETNPEWDVFRYKYFSYSDTITERQMGKDKLHEKNITLNDDGSVTYVFPFDINGDALVYNASSQNKLELVLKDKSDYSPISEGKFREVTPVNFNDPYSIGGAYDMLTFEQTNTMNVNVGAKYYYETGSIFNKVKGNSLDRMIGEVSIIVDTINKTINMDSKIQMNSPRLKDPYLGQDLSTQQFQVTNYDQVSYNLSDLSNNQSFGDGNAQTNGKVTPNNDIWEERTSDIKIYSEFKQVINVTVSVYAKKKSDTPVSLDMNTAYYCTNANYTANAQCPNPEPDASKGVVTQLWN